MQAIAESEWRPDWATHPGEHLEEHLAALKLTHAEFARRADLAPHLVSAIILKRSPVSAETALKFERVLGVGAVIWSNLQANWDAHQARLRERESAKEEKSWFKRSRGVSSEASRSGEIINVVIGFVVILLSLIGIGRRH